MRVLGYYSQLFLGHYVVSDIEEHRKITFHRSVMYAGGILFFGALRALFISYPNRSQGMVTFCATLMAYLLSEMQLKASFIDLDERIGDHDGGADLDLKVIAENASSSLSDIEDSKQGVLFINAMLLLGADSLLLHAAPDYAAQTQQRRTGLDIVSWVLLLAIYSMFWGTLAYTAIGERGQSLKRGIKDLAKLGTAFSGGTAMIRIVEGLLLCQFVCQYNTVTKACDVGVKIGVFPPIAIVNFIFSWILCGYVVPRYYAPEARTKLWRYRWCGRFLWRLFLYLTLCRALQGLIENKPEPHGVEIGVAICGLLPNTIFSVCFNQALKKKERELDRRQVRFMP